MVVTPFSERKRNNDIREHVVAYLGEQLMGPADGPDEVINTPPHLAYVTGVLHPQKSSVDELLDEGEQVGVAAREKAEDTSFNDDPVRMANEWNPSSLGITFYCLDTDSIAVSVWGATYEELDSDGGNRGSKENAPVGPNGGSMVSGVSADENDGNASTSRRSSWKRRSIASESAPETIRLVAPSSPSDRPFSLCLGGRGRLVSRWRRLGAEGWFITVSLVNSNFVVEDADARTDPADCLFQVGLRCDVAPSGRIVQYPDVRFVVNDAEDVDLRFLYRERHVFAAGHGCAATWETRADESVSWVRSEFIPSFIVPAVTRETGHETRVDDLAFLADPATKPSELISGFRSFVGAYADWIDERRAATESAPRFERARARVFSRLDDAVARMLAGVDLLERNENVRGAFRLANEAMLTQMRRTAVIRRRKDRTFTGSPPHEDLRDPHRWRPFQLAFFLLVLPSLVDENDNMRDLVDLIWFPTGGGKTEAYLLAAAFEIILRRCRYGDSGGGTAVLTRYTLRLLTTQQFQRSATLITALESMRRAGRIEGNESVSIGLWVGAKNTPNTYMDAKARFEEVRERKRPTNPFALETCPWCGTDILPKEWQEDDQAYGVRASVNSFAFFCPSPTCEFHDRLPVAVVDQHLYAEPPTFLIATVDKFARMAWVGEAGAFFGRDNIRPPSLIIQDELHLLSGPLGTMVGLYESAIRRLIEMKGYTPKVIASTATIRGASEQASGLFGRPVKLFPPSGPTDDDSYFAKTDHEAPGRMYVGIMSQTHTTKSTQVNLSAALLQAPVHFEMTGDQLNAYFTQVIYHNTLRELGHSMTLVQDDIDARLQARYGEGAVRTLEEHQVMELTSNVPGDELPEVLSSLERVPEDLHDESAVSVLCTTNMISVGVDIGRLGLMTVIGQPKSTSEYIQATSRVGRKDEFPGLVVTLYAAAKPRDRSHYESFIGYHQSLYRYVEPSSVTPFSLPARNRALHAALVILVRHGIRGMAGNRDAHRFDPDSEAVKGIVEFLASYAADVDPYDNGATREHLDQLRQQWVDQVKDAERRGKKLLFEGSGRQDAALLRKFEDSYGKWATPNSMRFVDQACSIKVMGEP